MRRRTVIFSLVHGLAALHKLHHRGIVLDHRGTISMIFSGQFRNVPFSWSRIPILGQVRVTVRRGAFMSIKNTHGRSHNVSLDVHTTFPGYLCERGSYANRLITESAVYINVVGPAAENVQLFC